MQQFANFKASGDDALHRQIDKPAPPVTIHGLPQRRVVNRLLDECAVLL